MVYEKSVTNFYTLDNFGAPGDPLYITTQTCELWFTSLSGDVQQDPRLSSCQILSPSDNPCTRYLLPKFVDFVDGVTDNIPQTI